VKPRWFRAGAQRLAFTEGTARVGEIELAVRVDHAGSGRRVDWSVRNPGRDDVILNRVGLGLDATPVRVLEQGWQSWSAVRACSPADIRHERHDVPAWRRAVYFAEPERAGLVVAGDQFLVTDEGVAGFLDGRRHFGVVEVGPEPPHALTAWALLDGVRLGPGEERRLEPFWFASGDPGPLYCEYAARWGTEAGARAHTRSPAGWCSWYNYRASVTPADVRANLAEAAAHGLEVVQIDDGYQRAVGQWLSSRPSWSDGTQAVADDIRAAGLKAGIWTAPFLVDEDGPIASSLPAWVLDRAMHNPVWWGGWALALDTTHPAVLDHLTSTFAALRAQGFDYHKVDFLYAAALSGNRFEPSMTRAQALRAGLEAVRLGIGEDAFLLGCGSPFGPAVGVVDAMRVSPDVAPWWLPQNPLPGMDEAASCARNAIRTSVLRAPLHRRLWANDPDCVLLHPATDGLAEWQRLLVAATVAGTGGLVMASDDLATYEPEDWELLATVRAIGAASDEPLELLDPCADTLTVRSSQFELIIGSGGPGTSTGVVIETPGGRLIRR
jgi:alpha-galactosidase